MTLTITPDEIRKLIQKGLEDIARMQAQVDSGVNLFLIDRIEEFKWHISILEKELEDVAE